MKQRNHKAFWAAFWGGIAAPALLCAADKPKISRVEFVRLNLKSDVESMRSDWINIGKDFNSVIRREEQSAR